MSNWKVHWDSVEFIGRDPMANIDYELFVHAMKTDKALRFIDADTGQIAVAN